MIRSLLHGISLCAGNFSAPFIAEVSLLPFHIWCIFVNYFAPVFLEVHFPWNAFSLLCELFYFFPWERFLAYLWLQILSTLFSILEKIFWSTSFLL